MGRIFFDIEDYKTALDLEIANCMRDPDGTVQTEAKKAIIRSAKENVYDAYPKPKFESRRGTGKSMGGGIMDEDNLLSFTSEKGFTLTIQNLATWQHLYGGAYPSNDLADVIENNQIYGAPKRPFMQKAEDEYSDRFGLDLVEDLEFRGF